jgi:hypothetical protein
LNSTNRLERESDIQYGCKRLLEAVGFWCGSLSQGRKTRQSAGLPDVIALHPQHGVLFVEAKQRTGVQSAAQQKFEQRCVAAGVPYVVARSVAELQGYLRLRGLLA